MSVLELKQERYRLANSVRYHLSELYMQDNPQGILLCQKNGKHYRWQHKYLYNDLPITIDIGKKKHLLAEKLAVNLYRIINIRFLQEQIRSIDQAVSGQNTGVRQDGSSDEAGGRMFSDTELISTDTRPQEGQKIMQALYGKTALLLRKVQNYPRRPADFFAPGSPYSFLIMSYLQKKYKWIIDWYLGEYQQNPEHPEYLVFPTELGFNVRSKSEAMIADLLYHEGILFHYEEQMLLSGHPVHPDFRIPITVDEEYMWEHFGAMDKDSYYNRTRGRILDYLDERWLPGINMITTYETKFHPFNSEKAYRQINWIKNRYWEAFPDLPADGSLTLYDLICYEGL